MKALYFCAVIGLSVLGSYSTVAQNLRVIGTNLYDFSYVAASHTQCPYLLQGYMAGTVQNGIILRPPVRYKFTVPRDTSKMDRATKAAYDYGRRVSKSGVLTISVWEHYRLTEECREFFYEVQPHNITLLNYPPDRAEGIAMEVYAIPVTGTIWNYGKPPPPGFQTNFTSVCRVLVNGIVRVPCGTNKLSLTK